MIFDDVSADIRIPLDRDESGTIRVAGTRVSIDVVVNQYRNGADIDDIVSSFPTLTLADTHLVIAYWLENRDLFDRYFQERSQQIDAMKTENKVRYPNTLRRKLLARQKNNPSSMA